MESEKTEMQGLEQAVGDSSVSEKKLAANRRNAMSSTGPKTEAGKRHSRGNALKHGILAAKLLVTDGKGAEDSVTFEELLEDLRHDLMPGGELEELMVEKIAICYWRLRRALQAEAGSIRRGYFPSASDRFDHVVNPGRVMISDHLSLPSSEDMNRILRYEASIQRQLAFAINQLERLQRARKGEPVPAPLSVGISGRA